MSRRGQVDFSDRELANEIRSGSSVAFEQLMRRYSRLAYKVAYGFLGDVENAMDVTQTTFLKVHERLDSWRGDGDLKNWIARIAANESLNLVRSQQRQPTGPIEDDLFLQSDPTQEQGIDAIESRQALHRSLESLNPRQRLAVILRYFRGMSPRQISTVLECSEGQTRNILFRSLRKLRSELIASEEAL
jgi:RNA polymerase sigma-70 factor (ECF subfamily)